MGTVRTLPTPTAGVRLADAAKVFLGRQEGAHRGQSPGQFLRALPVQLCVPGPGPTRR